MELLSLSLDELPAMCLLDSCVSTLILGSIASYSTMLQHFLSGKSRTIINKKLEKRDREKRFLDMF